MLTTSERQRLVALGNGKLQGLALRQHPQDKLKVVGRAVERSPQRRREQGTKAAKSSKGRALDGAGPHQGPKRMTSEGSQATLDGKPDSRLSAELDADNGMEDGASAAFVEDNNELGLDSNSPAEGARTSRLHNEPSGRERDPLMCMGLNLAKITEHATASPRKQHHGPNSNRSGTLVGSHNTSSKDHEGAGESSSLGNIVSIGNT